MVNSSQNNEGRPEPVERRQHRRVGTPLKARILLPGGDEHPCDIENISAGGALIRARRAPSMDDRIILYIDQLGRFEAIATRVNGERFSVDFQISRAKATRTAAGLTEILNKGERAEDRRNDPRIRNDKPATVQFADGHEQVCTILDISLTGASIEIRPRPPLGAQLKLGCMMAKVVRRHETGVGVVFSGSAENMGDVCAAAEYVEPSLEPQRGAERARSFGKKPNSV